MSSDAEIIIAFLFKRSGKDGLSFSDIYLNLSMELNWFTPDEAKAFVNMAINEKLLIKKESLIKPNFDINKIVVPIGFIPSKTVFEEKEIKIINEEVLLGKIIQKIAEKTKLDEKHINDCINNIAKGRNLTKEVAALIFSKEQDIVFEEFYEEIEKRIVER